MTPLVWRAACPHAGHPVPFCPTWHDHTPGHAHLIPLLRGY